MTLSWNPTTGHTYKIYEVVNGTRAYKGTTTTGSYAVTGLARGTHYFVVTSTNAAGESIPSNEVTFVKQHK